MKALFFVCLIFLSVDAIANEKKNWLTGDWECAQQEKITDTMLGVNTFTVEYISGGTSIKQIGKVVVHDETQPKDSIITYNLLFNTVYADLKFINVLESIDYSIVQDGLNVFGGNISSFFPVIGEEISGEITELEENYLKNVYSDGSVIECDKSIQ